MLCAAPSSARKSTGPPRRAAWVGFIDNDDCPANSESFLATTGCRIDVRALTTYKAHY